MTTIIRRKKTNKGLTENDMIMRVEEKNRNEIEKSGFSYSYLYPSLDDPLFNLKISKKKEFYDTSYDGKQEGDIKEISDALCNAEFELAPHQMFVRNFMSFQTPYNGLLLYHGLGSGKTCSAISVAEEMRDYMKQMGIVQRIIVVASPNVQENFKLQLFDERKLQQVDGLWNIRACTGNKYLKEINPMSMKGLSKERVIAQVTRIINASYLFMGYLELANYIVKISAVESDLPPEKIETMSKSKLRKHFENRLIIIDEVHNIRMTDENKDKRVAMELEKLVDNVPNLRLLLLSATPMYNSYKEIIWLLNILNKNDRRSTIEYKDVFTSNGSFKVSKNGEEIGKELLLRKARGYVSFVRGENPYLFPFRIWPSEFSPENTFENYQKPTIQMNGQPIIASSKALNVLSVYLCNVGEYQSFIYDYIIQRLKSGEITQAGPKGHIMPSFENMESVGYALLQRPIEALNIVYPDERLDGGNIIDTKDIVGKAGLNRIMKSTETVSPVFRGNFEYNSEKYGRIFSPEQIGKYSGKIKNICENVVNSKGVILIYSQYIDAGLIPIALALEELGFTRAGRESLFKTPPVPQTDAITFKPNDGSPDFIPAKYVMITGTESISPDNVAELKLATDPDNLWGQMVKVILISQAGAEGLDFKFIRQVHILEPWYNMNRPEQIIGRAVRSCSHKDLPFSERNVEIYLYGSILSNEREEAADLYLYRLAELKALQIGNVSRVLKENAIDCILNTKQQDFSISMMNAVVKQNLSSGITIDYKVGDRPYSSTCDYMKICEYRCIPDALVREDDVVLDTYNETFIVMNNDKIIQNIRRAFKERFYFHKDRLIAEINITRNYPLLQINSALEQLVNDRNEYVTDMYNRIGRIVNIGELYLFQPIELDNKNISLYERSVPVEFKHQSISFNIKQKIGDNLLKMNIKPSTIGEKIIKSIIDELDIIFSDVVNDKPETWADYAKGSVLNLKELGYDNNLIETSIIHHLIESLQYEEVVNLLNHFDKNLQDDDNNINRKIQNYFQANMLNANGYQGILLQQSGKRVLLVRPDDKRKTWEKGGSEDEKDFKDALTSVVMDILPLGVKTGAIIGFMSSFKKQFMVYKYRDINAKGTKGARCDQSKKNDVIKILNTLIGDDTYSKTTNIPRPELCITQELILRILNIEKKDNKRWFLTPGEAVVAM